MPGQLYRLSGFHGMYERWQFIFSIDDRILFLHERPFFSTFHSFYRIIAILIAIVKHFVARNKCLRINGCGISMVAVAFSEGDHFKAASATSTVSSTIPCSQAVPGSDSSAGRPLITVM